MKKLISGITIILTLCIVLSSVMTACSSKDTTTSSPPGTTPSASSTPPGQTTTPQNSTTTPPPSNSSTTTEPPVTTKNTVAAVPSASSVKAGETFDLAIRVTALQPSRGMQFSIKWDPSKVECTSVEKGAFYESFASSNGGELFYIPSDQPVADNEKGIFPKTNDPLAQMMIAMNEARDAGGNPLGAKGTGDVFILHMVAKTGVSGQVDFTLSQVQLSDAGLAPKDLVPEVVNGKIVITQ